MVKITKSHRAAAINSYKKQHGLHHRIDRKYGQVYWPYLPVLIFVIVGLLSGIVLFNHKISNSSTSISSVQLLNNINQIREKNHLNTLTSNPDLITAAQMQANSISTSNSWSPITQSRDDAFNFISIQEHNLSIPKENLAYGFNSASQVVTAWSSSSYQDNNLLSSSINSVGYAVVTSPNFMNQGKKQIVVAIFDQNRSLPITSGSHSNLSTASTNVPSVLAVTRLSNLIDTNSPTEYIVVITVLSLIALYLIINHTRKLHKWFSKGEDLFLAHPMIDIFLVIIFVILIGYSQTIGYIS
ncbi:MAG TPA: CAP domain-containing protein [Candidatus Saccharimonadia bacterium]|nr:CAP domain-containing protein [Candidatus Saccharimonadia bacterium]